MLLIRLFIAFGGLLLILNASPVFANAQSAIKSYWAGNYSAAFEEFLPLARNGDLVSQRYLGDMYSLGQGLEQDFAKAMTWYQFSSDQGDEWAQYELGKIYEVGEGVPIDKKKALKWYRESADQGNYFAQFRLGYMFEIGGGVPEDKAEAVRWYLLSADQGYAWAQLSLGAMYRNGEGVSVDKAEAIKWYRASAKQGNALAQYALGEMYRNGGGVDEDKAEAIKWYSASAKQGNAWAQYALGEMYRNGEGVGEDKAEAIKWYKASSKQGNAWAQYDLGEMYRNGEGVDEDKAEAMKWYRLSADQGNEFSQYHLGDMYRNGEGVSEDIINAIKWYYLAAEQGSNEARFQLGLLYFDGRGVPEDKSKAFKFFHNAAKEGHDISQAMLATQYLKGEGITKNIGLSKSWAQKSADQNNLGGLWVLGEISLVEEQFLVAEMQFETALKTDENLKFSNPILFALISDSLGRLKQDLGKISEAKKIIEDVLEVKKDLYGKNSNDYVRSLNILAGLNFDRRQFEKAGRLFSEGIDLIDNNVDGEISLKIELLHNLGLLYAAQERLDLARDYINSAISLYESSELSGSLSLAQIFNTQAVISIRMRDLASAKEYLNNAMNFLEENAKETDTIYLAIKTNLAIIFEGEGNHQLAKLAFEEILKHTNSYGYQNKYSANAHFNLGRIHSVLGHYDEAEKHLQKTLEIQRVVYGSDSLNLATTHLALFTTYMSQGKIEASYKHGKYAVNIFDRMFALRISSNISNALAQKNFFAGHLSTISIMATDESFKSLYNDSVSIAFRSSQIVKLSAAGYSLAQLAMRSTFDNGGLSDLVRLQQDLQKELEYQVLMRDDIHATSTKKTVAGTSKINDVEIIKKKLTHVENKINKQFPKFSKYTVMQTMDISDLQNLLRDGEALFTNTPNTYDDTNTVFFITRDGVHTYQTGMKTSEIQKTVLNLRRGLDLSGSFSIESFPEFDLRLSYKLYNSIFGPVKDVMGKVSHLLISPNGALEKIPFQILVTKNPPETINEFDNYQNSDWLIRTHSLSRLPAINSIRYLRNTNQKNQFTSGFIGFGNPVLAQTTAPLRGLKAIEFDGKNYTLSHKIRRLPSLPNTEKEILAIAGLLDLESNSVFLRNDATETNVKSIDLSKASFLSFATHGLSANQFDLAKEPSLIFTPPDIPTALDDGLLLASEIAQLRINADVVLLSACNTADGLTPGGESLSGLARAFFYAGAKSVVVSHWRVISGTTKDLMIGMIKKMRNKRSLPMHRALQLSILDLIDNEKIKYSAHPAAWAPFSLVGEGATIN